MCTIRNPNSRVSFVESVWISIACLDPWGCLRTSPFTSEHRFSRFHTRAWLSFAPPPCRMPLGPSQASPKLIPEDGSAPDFRWTEGQSDQQAVFAADLVRRQVAVIVTGTIGVTCPGSSDHG